MSKHVRSGSQRANKPVTTDPKTRPGTLFWHHIPLSHTEAARGPVPQALQPRLLRERKVGVTTAATATAARCCARTTHALPLQPGKHHGCTVTGQGGKRAH